MTDWPRIRTDVDDDRPARDDEVEYCQRCGAAVLIGELKPHFHDWRCDRCRPLCVLGCGESVNNPGEFCEMCAAWAMGVEV